MKIQACLFFVLIMLPSCKENEKSSVIKQRPNIVFIISDDQAWTDYGFMGHPEIETPNIDELARKSLTYTRGYVTAPLCCPSLASIISGLYPHQHLVTGNDPVFETDARGYSEEWLSERMNHFDTLISRFREQPLLTNILSEQGYVSFQTGKWWMGSYMDGGFDYGMTHGIPENGGRHGDEGLKIGREGMDTIYHFLDMAQSEKKPFFLWYAPFLPHTPHNPPDSLLQKYLKNADSEPLARYRANCEWFDITVGRLMGYLQENNLMENTAVFYVCDNGWVQNPDKRNRYMKGSKRSPYDMGIRTPIMLHWPGRIESRMDTVTLTSSIDMVPTVLEFLNIPKSEDMPGISLLNYKELTSRNTIFSEVYYHDMNSMLEPPKNLKYRVIIRDNMKMVLPYDRNLPDSSIKLYNIMNDPLEKNNISNEYPQKIKELTTVLNKWWEP